MISAKETGVPDVGVAGEADAGGLGEEVAAMGGAGDAHDEQGHAFLAVQEAAAFAVEEGLFAEHAGVNGAHGVEQGGEAFFARAAVHDEDAVVFAGEGVAARVFEHGGGADDVGRLAEVIQHALELLEYVGGEAAREDAAAAFVEFVEEGLVAALFFADPPDFVFDEEAHEDFGADEEGVVDFEAGGEVGGAVAEDGAGDEHAEGFAADGADADHAAAHGDEVFERELLFDEGGAMPERCAAKARRTRRRSSARRAGLGRAACFSRRSSWRPAAWRCARPKRSRVPSDFRK